MSSGFSNTLPKKFIEVLGAAHGQRGWDWIVAGLPETIREIELIWKITVGPPFQNLSYHFVAPCVMSDGTLAVVKIGFPEPNSPMANEARMLKMYAGNGAVEILRFDPQLFSTLLERLEPGTILKKARAGSPSAAVKVAIRLLKQIILPPSESGFTLLSDWISEFDGLGDGDFSATSLHKAQSIYGRLSSAPLQLLHGDFHHENILSSGRRPFLVIDPKGVIGQIGYEIAVFLNNHLRWLGSSETAEIKLAVSEFASSFRIAERELREWAYVQSVLSAFWTWQENTLNWKNELSFAEFWDV